MKEVSPCYHLRYGSRYLTSPSLIIFTLIRQQNEESNQETR